VPYTVPITDPLANPVDQFMFDMGIEDIWQAPDSFWLSMGSALRHQPMLQNICAARLEAITGAHGMIVPPDSELIIDLRNK